MRNIISKWIVTLLIILTTGMGACDKDENKTSEEPLRISNDAGTLSLTPGPELEFNLTIESKMPAEGVWVEISLKGETDNLDYPQGATTATREKVTKLKVRNLPRQKICVCTISVTSKLDFSNRASTNFRVAYK